MLKAVTTEHLIRAHLPDHHSPEQIESRYRSLITNPRFFQFANIPRRIIQCLDSFSIRADNERVHAALLAYYIFIGVTDDTIDGGDEDAGENILARLTTPFVSLNDITVSSDAEFMSELLKLHFPASHSSHIRSKFRTIHKINLRERRARNMRAFVKMRELLGSVTADISYLLIQEHVEEDARQLRRLMKRVGAVGCLVDSAIDLRNDQRAGLIGFRPALTEWVYLYVRTFWLGIRTVAKYPRLVRLFFEAIADNAHDRRRSFT